MKNKRNHIYCSFFLNNRRLGGGYVPEGSTKEQRDIIARKRGIMFYNAIVFNDRGVYFKFRYRKSGVKFTTKLSNGISV